MITVCANLLIPVVLSHNPVLARRIQYSGLSLNRVDASSIFKSNSYLPAGIPTVLIDSLSW